MTYFTPSVTRWLIYPDVVPDALNMALETPHLLPDAPNMLQGTPHVIPKTPDVAL